MKKDREIMLVIIFLCYVTSVKAAIRVSEWTRDGAVVWYEIKC